MHYHAEVIVKSDENLDDILAPHQEDKGGFWDWYQVGGRWTGIKSDSHYSPDEDERNIETCDLCQGTGLRSDTIGKAQREKDPSYRCNGCEGKGNRVKWPTEWAPYEGDTCDVGALPEGLSCHTLVTSGDVFHVEHWTGDSFEKTEFDGNVAKKLKELGISQGKVITVDYHS